MVQKEQQIAMVTNLVQFMNSLFCGSPDCVDADVGLANDAKFLASTSTTFPQHRESTQRIPSADSELLDGISC
jgi:hypothetical protein